MHTELVQVLLVLICSLIFGYYAHQSLTEYLSYKTVSKQAKEKQEEQMMPQICLSSPTLAEERLQKLGITFEEYTKEGIWTSSHPNYSTASENEIKRIVFPHLTDMLNSLKVRSRIGKNSDKYEKAEYKSEELLNGTDIKVVTLDYYSYFSIYCFSFPNSSFPFGIQKVYFDMKQRLGDVYVVAPGNFYTFDRKRNHMKILAGQNYEYQVRCEVWVQGFKKQKQKAGL